MELSISEAAIYALDRLTLALLIGTSAIWLIINSDQRTVSAAALKRLIDTALITLLITTLAVLLLRTASLAEVSLTETAPFISRVLSGSDFGALWMVRSGVLLILIAAWMLSSRTLSLSNCILMTLGALITALCISGASHAGDEGVVTLDNFINTTHIAAGCLWGGAIIAYALMLKSTLREASIATALSAERLSTLATFALVGVVTTGIFNSWQRLETLNELWSSSYGLTLLFKLSFVGAMMTLGALNRFYIVPAISRAQSGAALRLSRILYVDATLFLVVISGAAALGMQSPSH